MAIETKAEADAKNFLRYAFGEVAVGVSESESFERAYSPELRAFFQGRLGTVPALWWYATPALGARPQETAARKAVAEFLREIADTLSPTTDDEQP